MKPENRPAETASFSTRELAEGTGAVFVNGDAHAYSKSLSDRGVSRIAFRAVFSDVFTGKVDASSLF